MIPELIASVVLSTVIVFVMSIESLVFLYRGDFRTDMRLSIGRMFKYWLGITLFVLFSYLFVDAVYPAVGEIYSA